MRYILPQLRSLCWKRGHRWWQSVLMSMFPYSFLDRYFSCLTSTRSYWSENHSFQQNPGVRWRAVFSFRISMPDCLIYWPITVAFFKQTLLSSDIFLENLTIYSYSPALRRFLTNLKSIVILDIKTALNSVALWLNWQGSDGTCNIRRHTDCYD